MWQVGHATLASPTSTEALHLNSIAVHCAVLVPLLQFLLQNSAGAAWLVPLWIHPITGSASFDVTALTCLVPLLQFPLQNAANAAWLARLWSDRPGASRKYACWGESQVRIAQTLFSIDLVMQLWCILGVHSKVYPHTAGTKRDLNRVSF